MAIDRGMEKLAFEFPISIRGSN